MTSLWPFLQILDLQAISRKLIPEPILTIQNGQFS